MRATQDKDFDKLFKDGLEDAEILPSAELWGAIEAKITPKKKVLKFGYWAAAASVLMVGAITLVVSNQKDVVTSQQVAVVKPIVVKAQIDNKLQPKVEVNNDGNNRYAAVSVKDSKSKLAPRAQSKKLVLIEKDRSSVEKQNRVLAAVNETELATTVAKQTEEISILKPKDATLVQEQEKTILAAVGPVHQETPVAEENVAPPKSIKNAGDLINLVVNAVDKGKNKFIRFKTNDEGSTLAAVNIGPFRFGKRDD